MKRLDKCSFIQKALLKSTYLLIYVFVIACLDSNRIIRDTNIVVHIEYNSVCIAQR